MDIQLRSKHHTASEASNFLKLSETESTPIGALIALPFLPWSFELKQFGPSERQHHTVANYHFLVFRARVSGLCIWMGLFTIGRVAKGVKTVHPSQIFDTLASVHF